MGVLSFGMSMPRYQPSPLLIDTRQTKEIEREWELERLLLRLPMESRLCAPIRDLSLSSGVILENYELHSVLDSLLAK